MVRSFDMDHRFPVSSTPPWARHPRGGLTFAPPSGWLDRTVVAYTSPAESTKPLAPSIVITREPVRPGDTLRLHGNRQLMELEAQLEHFDLVESREAELGGFPALFYRYTWVSHVGALEQTMTLALSMHDGDSVMTTVTTTAARGDARDADAAFAGMLATMRFDDPGSPEPARISTIVPAPAAVASMADLPSFPMPGVGRGARR